MVKEAGIYMLILFLVYTMSAVALSLLGGGLTVFKEYIGLKKKGYTEEHEEIKGKENIYHSRLVGKPRVKRSVSEDARAILEEVTQKKNDKDIEEDTLIEDEEEETLPEYMIERPEKKVSEDIESIPRDMPSEKKEHQEEPVLSSTGVLEREEGISDSKMEESDSSRDEGTGLLCNDDTGVLMGDSTGLLHTDATGLLDIENVEERVTDQRTGLLKKNNDATGLLSREGTGLLKGINMDVFTDE